MSDLQPSRSDDELASYVPTLGTTWQDCGFVSLDEFKRWTRIRNATYDKNFSAKNRLTYVDRRSEGG